MVEYLIGSSHLSPSESLKDSSKSKTNWFFWEAEQETYIISFLSPFDHYTILDPD